MPETQSEIVRLRLQIELEYLAGHQALSGLAYGTSQHQFVTHKLENMERCRKELVTLVGAEEASKVFIDTLDQVQRESEARS